MEKMSVWRCDCGQVFNGNGSLMRDMGAFWHLVRDGEKYRRCGPVRLDLETSETLREVNKRRGVDQ